MLSRFAALASVSLTRKVSLLQTAVNPQSEDIDLPPVSFVEWAGADGWPMQGLYYPPCGERGAGPPPTLMYVHGGPIGVQTDKYNAAGAGGPCSIALLQQAGYAVFSPNYRGSVGWGLAFAEADWEDCGGKDWQDMQAGLDHLIAEGTVDADQLGVLGWSYGGFTTAWAVSQTDRFKCGIMGAGYVNGDAFSVHLVAVRLANPGKRLYCRATGQRSTASRRCAASRTAGSPASR